MTFLIDDVMFITKQKCFLMRSVVKITQRLTKENQNEDLLKSNKEIHSHTAYVGDRNVESTEVMEFICKNTIVISSSIVV